MERVKNSRNERYSGATLVDRGHKKSIAGPMMKKASCSRTIVINAARAASPARPDLDHERRTCSQASTKAETANADVA